MCRFFSLIPLFFAQGGIEICTRHDTVEKESAGGKEKFLLRTFIQPDGDMICFTSPEALTMPEVLKEHECEVRKMLHPIRVFRMVTNRAVYLTPVPGLCGFIYSGWAGLKWGVLGAIPLLFKPLLHGVLNKVIHKEINKLTNQKRE